MLSEEHFSSLAYDGWDSVDNYAPEMKTMASQEDEERPPGYDIEEWDDGSIYEGEFRSGLKHGKGKYSWKTGEYYEGRFYKDYCHGEGLYFWPSGHKFTGKFYLNRREGYGHQLFPDGTSFQGLYHLDHRFGPGIMTYPNGQMDVGLWVGKYLHKLCDAAEESFTLENFPEYAAYMDPGAPIQGDLGRDRLLDYSFVPPGIERSSADGDLSLLIPAQRRDLDQVFFGDLWEADHYQGERDPAFSLTLQARVEAHIHKHRLAAEKLSWDVGAVLAPNRKDFGPKGPLEVISEQLIRHAARGDLQTVSKIIRAGLVHPDVADSRGNTALIVATVNRHHDVLQLLLDVGADIDKLNSEGMSALAVCHVLYYPFHCLHAAFTKPPNNTQVLESLSKDENSPDISQVDPSTCEVALSSQSPPSDPTSREISSLASEKQVVQESRKEKRKDYLNTLELLVKRGADPNMSRIPMPVLFLAILACDGEGIKRLLLLGARTDIPLSPERKGLYPLHVAAALPGPAGPEITEMLLHTVQDPDARANDHDEIFELDKVFMKGQKSTSESATLKEGGRTALHVACQRDRDHLNASKIVALLLSHRANANLLWSGHSPLSLAIATGNILAVEALLNGGADPNLPLGPSVGSALCAFANIHYTLNGNKEKLMEMLVKAGADILMPVMVDGLGTAMDYAYYSFNQDLHITCTPFNHLSAQEQDIFRARCRLLCMMRDQMRAAAHSGFGKAFPKFCYYCGRSVSVTLTPCYRCYKVLYCSRPCRLKAWDAIHKKECFRVKAGTRDCVAAVGLSQNGLETSTVIQGDPRENYTFN